MKSPLEESMEADLVEISKLAAGNVGDEAIRQIRNIASKYLENKKQSKCICTKSGMESFRCWACNP